MSGDIYEDEEEPRAKHVLKLTSEFKYLSRDRAEDADAEAWTERPRFVHDCFCSEPREESLGAVEEVIDLSFVRPGTLWEADAAGTWHLLEDHSPVATSAKPVPASESEFWLAVDVDDPSEVHIFSGEQPPLLVDGIWTGRGRALGSRAGEPMRMVEFLIKLTAPEYLEAGQLYQLKGGKWEKVGKGL